MPLNAKGKKVMSRMKKTYGAEKAKQVFYAMVNEGKLKEVESEPRTKKGPRKGSAKTRERKNGRTKGNS